MAYRFLLLILNRKELKCIDRTLVCFLLKNNLLLFFDDVIVPGEEGKGIRYLFDALNPERLLGSAASVGLADYVIKKGAEYACYRSPFDKTIGSYQSTQHPLASAKAHLEAARLMMYKACENFE